MKSAVFYGLWILLAIVVYPNIDVSLYKFLAIRDLDIVFFTSIASLVYIVYQLRLALSSNLEDRSRDHITSLLPVTVLIITSFLIFIFYEGHLYRDWYYNVIIVIATLYLDIVEINRISNIILKKTSEVTPMGD
jgi:hypothetical protein